MNIEYEAKIIISHADIRIKLKTLGAKLIKSKTFMKRCIFFVSLTDNIQRWLRVRDEGNYISCTLKQFNQTASIDAVQEYEIQVSDFDTIILMIKMLGYEINSYVENYREIWQLRDCLIMLDTWPWLDEFIEIESKSQKSVINMIEFLGLSSYTVEYGPTRLLYQKKYNILEEDFKSVNHLTFDDCPWWTMIR